MEAIFVLATKYRNGDGVPLDKVKAAELYRKAADMGDSYSQYDLAFMLDSGEGIEVDHEEAEKYFRLSADQGDTDACLCIGGILFEKGQYKDAEQYFLSAAMKEDVKAQYNMGLLYMGEYLGEPDVSKACEWFEMAAEKGFPYAQSMLGSVCLDAGDLKSAEKYFRSAAEQDEPTAQYNLAALGLSRQIQFDYDEAIELLAKSAKAGYEPAYELLMKIGTHGQ